MDRSGEEIGAVHFKEIMPKTIKLVINKMHIFVTFDLFEPKIGETILFNGFEYTIKHIIHDIRQATNASYYCQLVTIICSDVNFS